MNLKRKKSEKIELKKREQTNIKLKEINDNPDIKKWLLKSLKHTRTSCSDTHTDGIYINIDDKHAYRCKKCALIELLDQQNWDSSHSYNFDFDINVDLDLIN